MARRQVLVQLDDELVKQLDALADKLHTNRSELLRRSARTLLRAHDWAEADRQLVEAYTKHPQDPAEIAWIMAAQSRVELPPW